MMGLRIPTLVTIGLFALMYALFSLQFPAMMSLRVLANLLTDNAYLGILVIGMTVVIIAGGIDLSISAVMAFSSLFIAVAISQWGLHPLTAFALALAAGIAFGALIGAIIHYLEAPAFIVTLTAMFLARGSALALSQESIPVRHPLHADLAGFALPLPGGGGLSLIALVLILAFVAGGVILHRTRFGTRVYAIGGDARAALLMGAPVARTTILIYAFSGLMAALAGVVFSIYTQAGYALSGSGVELEAIAAVVIGGALLTGGSGGMIGAFFGVMILGLIQTYITFDGTLTSWWSKIATGLLILAFLLLRALGDRWRRPRRTAQESTVRPNRLPPTGPRPSVTISPRAPTRSATSTVPRR